MIIAKNAPRIQRLSNLDGSGAARVVQQGRRSSHLNVAVRSRRRRQKRDGRPMPDWAAVTALMDGYAEDEDADVVFWNGQIGRPYDHAFIALCRSRKVKRTNVLLMLTTPGGDAHAAYRIARCLQRNWKHVTLFAPGWCKSAGTLLAIGANELVIGDFGELGPVDVQRPKEDDCGKAVLDLRKTRLLIA
jgi:hypothetical protein